MAKSKTAQSGGKQPTFAECVMEFWDDETGKPDQPSAAQVEDLDTAEAIARFQKGFLEWRRIQDDDGEAEARVEYASHAALYLTGIYPNCRINPPSYAAAAGEELGRFSGDIVKMVAERARRSSKTLPSVAHLVEWAQAEHDRRWKQQRALHGAVREYNAAIERGHAQAKQLCERLEGIGAADGLTADILLDLFQTMVGSPWGIDPGHDHGKKIASNLRRVFSRMEKGDVAAIGFARDASSTLAATRLEEEAAEQAGVAEQSAEADARYKAVCAAGHEAFTRLQAALAALASQPQPEHAKPVPAPSVGQVAHAKFGLGTVTAREGDKVDVHFDNHGAKQMLAHFLTESLEVAE